MDPFCSCGSACCRCIGPCCCCPSFCECASCIEIRNSTRCGKCGEHIIMGDNRMTESPQEAPKSQKAPKYVTFTSEYPGFRFEKLPDLDFLNPRPSSSATGYSSNSITESKRNDPPQTQCLTSSDSSSEEELMFQMDDIDTSLPPVAKSSFPRSYSTPGSWQVGVRLSDELSNETLRQLKVPTHTESTKYSPSKSPKSRESSPPCLFTVSKSPPSSVSPKKSPNCLSKSDTQISDCPRSLFPESVSQLATKQILPEIETQSPCIDGNELYSNSAAKPSDEVESDHVFFALLLICYLTQLGLLWSLRHNH